MMLRPLWVPMRTIDVVMFNQALIPILLRQGSPYLPSNATSQTVDYLDSECSGADVMSIFSYIGKTCAWV